MVRVKVLRRRLHKLDEYLEILHELSRYSLEEFLANPERYGSAERFLQLAIEALTDMGSHVVADLGLGAVESYSGIPQLLHRAEYIDTAMREAWIRMIGFRNILVRDYLEVDRKIVYRILHEGRADIRALRAMFASFL